MKNIKSALVAFLILTVITGIIYPLFITVIAQIAFPYQSGGSIYKTSDSTAGSELIGQLFTSPKYFWGRPSAISNKPMPSGGSNLSPVGKALKDLVQARVDTIRKYHGHFAVNNIPQELLFASASGVDPHISPETAYFQINRICLSRNFNTNKSKKLINLVKELSEHPQFGFLGTERINVLKLNMMLDKL